MTDEQKIANDRSQRLFMSTMLTMSWQLAIVVLFFLGSGYRMDQRLHTGPLGTLLGLLLTIIFAAVIVRKAVIDLDGSVKAIKLGPAAKKAGSK